MIEIFEEGSEDILASDMVIYSEQNAGDEASLYNFVFEDVPGGANRARITICSPSPDGDSFGVGGISVSTFQVCITCVLEGEIQDEEICNGDEINLLADYESTSYEAGENNGDLNEVSFLWSTGEETQSIDVSPTSTTTSTVLSRMN